MSCPNCNEEMSIENIDNQMVLHCKNCGASFFEENGINRISVQSAFDISQDKKTTEVSGIEKHCPKDKTALTSINNDESIPADITLLRCSQCKGILAYPDDLLAFKKAQDAKVNYFKLWQMPLPSLKAVVVLSFVALVSAAAFSRYIYFQNNSVGQTQASDLVKKVTISSSGRYVFISFKTQIPVKSAIVFRKPNGETINKQISQKPTTLHYLTTGDINMAENITYQLVLTDSDGKVLKVEEKKLKIQ